MAEVENHFTVFVRLPFNRADFVDPPPVAWSSTKERALWDVISRQKGNDLDWNILAEKFEVSQSFLLQQAAWLYERQLSQVRAQMRKVGASRQSATPSPALGSVSASMVGGYAMKRGGSGGSRVPSRLSTHARDSPTARSDDSAGAGTPVRSKASLPLRGTSGVVTSHPQKTAKHEAREGSQPMSRQGSREKHQGQNRSSGQHQLANSIVQESSESSESEQDAPATTLSSRRLNPASARHRRSPDHKTRQSRKASDPDDGSEEENDDDDDDDSVPFLPFANTAADPATIAIPHQDPSATLRGGLGSLNLAHRPTTQRRTTSERIVTATPRVPAQAQTLTSSASSASSGPTPITATRHRHTDSNPNVLTTQARPPGPLSPRQQAVLEAAGLSPRRRPGREGSDGTPSMGSSFSDLDDASITQSALEEALLSNMGNNSGNASMASRVSGISQALRSRYFDAQSGTGR